MDRGRFGAAPDVSITRRNGRASLDSPRRIASKRRHDRFSRASDGIKWAKCLWGLTFGITVVYTLQPDASQVTAFSVPAL